jgi:hypothetical protein
MDIRDLKEYSALKYLMKEASHSLLIQKEIVHEKIRAHDGSK